MHTDTQSTTLAVNSALFNPGNWSTRIALVRDNRSTSLPLLLHRADHCRRNNSRSKGITDVNKPFTYEQIIEFLNWADTGAGGPYKVEANVRQQLRANSELKSVHARVFLERLSHPSATLMPVVMR